jgi:hypothetical protein
MTGKVADKRSINRVDASIVDISGPCVRALRINWKTKPGRAAAGQVRCSRIPCQASAATP